MTMIVEPAGRAPFLVLAHHRSGSNFLHDLLQAHPCIECINEPLSMHTRFFRACDLVRWSADDHHPEHLHVSLARQAELRAFLLEMRALLHGSSSARVVGFKETVLFGKLEWLAAFMPTLRVVFLTREPHAIVSSVLGTELGEFWGYRERVPRAFSERFPGYTSRAADDAERDAEIAAMSVAVRYELARRALPLFEHHVVALEDVLRDPHRALRELDGFLGVDVHPEQLAFLQRRQTVSRGKEFSSFRTPDDVQAGWRRRLTKRQVDLIDGVLFAAACDAQA